MHGTTNKKTCLVHESKRAPLGTNYNDSSRMHPTDSKQEPKPRPIALAEARDGLHVSGACCNRQMIWERLSGQGISRHIVCLSSSLVSLCQATKADKRPPIPPSRVSLPRFSRVWPRTSAKIHALYTSSGVDHALVEHQLAATALPPQL